MAGKRESLTVNVNDTIETAMLKITENRHRAVIVMDGGKVVGIVSDGDLRRGFLKGILPLAPVEKIMNLNYVMTQERDPERLREIIRKEKVTVLPVVNKENDLVDIVLAYEPFRE